MKKIILCCLLSYLLLLLNGCIGSTEHRNPTKHDAYFGVSIFDHPKQVKRLWWQKDTATVKDSENPWNKFLVKNKVKDWSDPWVNYEQPKLFPEGWVPSKTDYLDDKRRNIILQNENKRLYRMLEKLLKNKKYLGGTSNKQLNRRTI